jgi:pimeloyl-ACP methyl ester carboxylesterase
LYALDLLGFGFSDKPATAPYSADLYVELISDFIKEVVEQPANLVSSSLSAAFAIRVADEYRDQVKRMVLISPVTSDRMTSRPGISGAAFYGLLHSPVLGKSFYNTMVSEKSIRDFALDEMYYDRRFVTSKLVSNLYSMSHQPGAEYAVTAYLSGYLNTETRQAFSRLLQPVTLVWGKQDKNNPIENAAELLQLNPQASLVILDRCRMMPQEEAEGEFNKAVMQTFTDQEETVQTRAV